MAQWRMYDSDPNESGATTVCLPSFVKWVIPMRGDALRARLRRLEDDTQTRALDSLHPVPGDDGTPQIEIAIFHTPDYELPPNEPSHDPTQASMATEHFHAYYELFDSPVRRAVPHLVADICPELAVRGDRRNLSKIWKRFREKYPFGGGPYTCMPASGTT
jgi:hypothetical protein